MSFSLLEALMLLCFGISWPFSIVRSYRARSARGKSLLFLIFLGLAYTCGILHKALVRTDIALALYIINFLMVCADIGLYARNTRLDKQRAATASTISQSEDVNL
jgi:hypothetical protein